MMKRISLAVILTIGVLAIEVVTSSAQHQRGQITPLPQNDCMQNSTFTTLFSVTPYQSVKQYHGPDRWTQANPFQTPANSWDCKIASRGPRPFCQATYVYHNRRLSNVYVTDDDQVVRCFWDAKYREDQESMGTLLAKGTTIYPAMVPDYYGVLMPTQIEGGTYPVSRSEFDCCQIVSQAELSQLGPAITANGQLFKSFALNGNLFVRVR